MYNVYIVDDAKCLVLDGEFTTHNDAARALRKQGYQATEDNTYWYIRSEDGKQVARIIYMVDADLPEHTPSHAEFLDQLLNAKGETAEHIRKWVELCKSKGDDGLRLVIEFSMERLNKEVGWLRVGYREVGPFHLR